MILHTLNTGPGSGSFSDCIAIAGAEDAIVLLGDGVYAALAGSAARELLAACPAQVHVLDTDADAAGVDPGDFQRIDMAALVTLTEHYPRQLAWY